VKHNVSSIYLSNANFIVPENVDIWMIHCASHVGTRIFPQDGFEIFPSVG
jgi:hypothetical protein